MKFLNSIAVLILVSTTWSMGQNLVSNPGLDQFISCPGFGQFGPTWIPGWNKPTIASSDYYNYNCNGIIPSKQAPYSGEGYAGIICYNFGTEYREYITGELLSPLISGTNYQVEFFVSLNDGYIQAIEEVDAYLSASAPGPFANALHISVTPQIVNTNGALNDTSSWVKIAGTFTASGGEQFITIGNFNDDQNTTITQPGSSGSFGAYYFIDDVSVVPVSTTSLYDNSTGLSFQLVQKGNGEIVLVFSESFNADQGYFYSTYDFLGRTLKQGYANEHNHSINFDNNAPGIYFINVFDLSHKPLGTQKFMLCD